MNGLDAQGPHQDKILKAIFEVKKKLQGVAKSTNNPFFKSKYADLNAYLDTVEPLLEEHGLMLLQPVTNAYYSPSMENVVTSRIYHVESGQSIESSMKLVAGTDMQKMGSGITYARRYTLGSLLSMQALDDDAEGMAERATKTAAKNTPVAQVQAVNLPKATLASPQPQPTAAPKEEAKPARPSFKRPAKAIQEAAPTAPVEDSDHGDDL